MIFMEKYQTFSLFIILIPTPDSPHFYYMLGVNLGSLLYGDVSLMFVITQIIASFLVHLVASEASAAFSSLPVPFSVLLSTA